MTLFMLSLPGLRAGDVEQMPKTRELVRSGSRATLYPGFPSVTWPVQANMITGCTPDHHGIVGNGIYRRDRRQVEMWTMGNGVIEAEQIWDRLHAHHPPLRSAVWFPMLAKGASADYICMPAPIHQPDGSESMWCYTRPEEFYGELLDSFGHFPLQHFWGPLANIESSRWIARTAAYTFDKFHPDFFFVYLPHLDYAAQKCGPSSPQAVQALEELDGVIGELSEAVAASSRSPVDWLIVGEYAITEVSNVVYPNRVLREAGLLQVVKDESGKEQIDWERSEVWALVDHQFAHLFVRDGDARTARRAADLFHSTEGIEEILVGPERARYDVDHPRCGEVIVISTASSWQAYYWWLDDDAAPDFARTVDIHRKPGYDPVELFFDPATRSIPLDATLVRGSHGAPVRNASQYSEIVCSRPGVLPDADCRDTDVFRFIQTLLD